MSILAKNGHHSNEPAVSKQRHPPTELDTPIADAQVKLQAVTLAYELATNRYFDERERLTGAESAATVRPGRDGNITIPPRAATDVARERLREAKRVWESAAAAKQRARRRLTDLEIRRMHLWRDMELTDPSNYHRGRVPETIQRIPR